jgi:hypothetical protein
MSYTYLLTVLNSAGRNKKSPAIIAMAHFDAAPGRENDAALAPAPFRMA